MDTCSLRSPTRRGHRYWPDYLLYLLDQVRFIQFYECLEVGNPFRWLQVMAYEGRG